MKTGTMTNEFIKTGITSIEGDAALAENLDRDAMPPGESSRQFFWGGGFAITGREL